MHAKGRIGALTQSNISLTVGAYSRNAKLQKEHTFGHGTKHAFSCSCASCATLLSERCATLLERCATGFYLDVSAAIGWFFSYNFRVEELMKRLIACVAVLLFAIHAFADEEHVEERVKDAGVVLKEILNIPDDIPQDLLDKAECIIVLPSVKKGAFGIGGSYGRGVMICRSGEHYKGKWGAPALYALEGISIGFQLGGQATDFVLLVMNPKGAESLLHSKVKLGADASAAAGPKGRTAEGATDVVMNAEILSYSRNKGLFAGISLEGSTLRSDGGANRKLYKRELTAKEIIRERKVGIPACARQLVSLLDTKSPVNKSDPKSLQ